MLVHHVDIRTDPDGLLVVGVTFDLSAAQAGAAAHAVRVIRDERYRNVEMSSDDVLAMREMTALADELSGIENRGMIDHVNATVARVGVLRSALLEFAVGEHLEREGDADARPIVFTLVDDVVDLHADAIRAALDPPGQLA